MIPRSALIEFNLGVPSSKYVTSTCCSPIYRRVRLSEDGSYRDMYCDCGRCITCQDRKRNEMASRMFLHATKYDYCYFVTLTYGSYNLLPYKYHPFLADWLATVPTYDSHNSFHESRWTPTILVKSHLQKFLKRLRKSSGSFTYCACGEYGSTHGRPHFHVILFSNVPISQEQIQDAWGLECKRTEDKFYIRPWRSDLPKTADNGYFKFSLGKVQVYDLYQNGSLNYDGKHPGQFNAGLSAMNNFTYVAKYIGKAKESLNNLPPWVYTRIRYAWSVYTDNLDALNQLEPNPNQTMLEIKNKVTFNFDNYEFKNIYFDDFKKLVSPFFLSSRRPAIGKQYFIENCSRFQAKSFTLPKFMGKSIQFPSYYFRLLTLKKYPIRIRKNVSSGISHTKDLLPRVYAYFSALREDSNFWYTVRSLPQPSQEVQYSHELNVNGVYLYSLTGNPSEGEVDYIDFVDPSGSVIHFVYNPIDEIFRGYIFNPHTKSYDLYEHYFDREDFCDMVLDEIEGEFNDFPTKVSNMQLQFDLQNTILSDCEALSERERYIKLRLERQQYYKSQNINTL